MESADLLAQQLTIDQSLAEILVQRGIAIALIRHVIFSDRKWYICMILFNERHG